jgi:hypothetical protein
MAVDLLTKRSQNVVTEAGTARHAPARRNKKTQFKRHITARGGIANHHFLRLKPLRPLGPCGFDPRPGHLYPAGFFAVGLFGWAARSRSMLTKCSQG